MRACARNNAQWCEHVCRSHGLPTRVDDQVWASLRRTPPLYPDAVTLRPGVRAEDVQALIDTSAGCSIKDSFADVDLAPAGFRVLFEAQWVRRPPGPVPDAPDSPEWREVTTSGGMGEWTAAHRSGNTLSGVLGRPLVTVLGAYDRGTLVGGAITNRSDDVVGVSNVFGDWSDAGMLWRGLVAAVVARNPGTPLVGYEHSESLGVALDAGFEPAGPLRVWLRD